MGGRRREPIVTAIKRPQTDAVLVYSFPTCACLSQAQQGKAVLGIFPLLLLSLQMLHQVQSHILHCRTSALK